MTRLIYALVALLLGCGRHAHDTPVAEPETVAITLWTATHEYFVEYPALVVGQRAQFAAHVTKLEDHSPATSGTLTVVVRPAHGAASEGVATAPARRGIFVPELLPAAPGPCTLIVRYDAANERDEASTPCTVHLPGAVPVAVDDEPSGGITFLKEQAWSSDLATRVAAMRDLVPTMRTTGEIRAMAGREARLTATASGRVVIDSPAPVLGEQIRAGQVLARIVPQVQNAGDRASLAGEARLAQTELAAAQTQLARTERLWAARTIPEKQLDEARTRVELARARLDAARGRLGQFDAGAAGRGGAGTTFQVRSPIAGTLVAIHVAAGETVEDGELLFTVVDLRRVWLHADVFEPDIAKVEHATRASFRVDGSDEPIVIEPPDGRVVTIGRLVDERTRTVPMIFELANPGERLRIGSLATVWIDTGTPRRVLAVPETAIVDDAGRQVVYVQRGGETFERRALRLGQRSGGWVEVVEGLEAGEHVVTRGAYEIKLAASGGAVPEHGHAH